MGRLNSDSDDLEFRRLRRSSTLSVFNNTVCRHHAHGANERSTRCTVCVRTPEGRKLKLHNVNFQEACEVFFDPFFRLVDATAEDEAREGATGYAERSRLLIVEHMARQEETIRITSARSATTEERKIYEYE
jgi:uncharacterized DUF497 family protein